MNRRTFLGAMAAAVASPILPKPTLTGDSFAPSLGITVEQGIRAVIDDCASNNPIAGVTFRGAQFWTNDLLPTDRLYFVSNNFLSDPPRRLGVITSIDEGDDA